MSDAPDSLLLDEAREADEEGTRTAQEMESRTAAEMDAVSPVVEAAAPGVLPPFPVPWRHPIKAAFWTARTLFGLASLILMLAVIAAIPIVNFIALGYLLAVEGAMARTGRFREAFPLLADAPRFGGIALGIWLFLLPLRYLGSMAADARLIDPGSAADTGWHIALAVARIVITLHIIFALARGGAITCFFRPIKNIRWLLGQLNSGTYLQTAGREIRAFVARLKLRDHFWLGLRGFLVALIWLVIPTAFYAAVRQPQGGQIVLMILGGLMLVVTLSWAPFLQAQFAAEEKFRSGLRLKDMRQTYRHAPLCCLLATVLLYLLALPLYLFKAFLLPQDAMWFITLIFIATIYPTKVLTGWAWYWARRRREEGRKAHWSWRWGCTLVLTPLLGMYVFILYFTQFLGQHGKSVLFEHHALMLPVPF